MAWIAHWSHHFLKNKARLSTQIRPKMMWPRHLKSLMPHLPPMSLLLEICHCYSLLLTVYLYPFRVTWESGCTLTGHPDYKKRVFIDYFYSQGWLFLFGFLILFLNVSIVPFLMFIVHRGPSVVLSKELGGR